MDSWIHGFGDSGVRGSAVDLPMETLYSHPQAIDGLYVTAWPLDELVILSSRPSSIGLPGASRTLVKMIALQVIQRA